MFLINDTRVSGDGNPSILRTVKIAYFTCTDSPYDKLQVIPRCLPLEVDDSNPNSKLARTLNH